MPGTLLPGASYPGQNFETGGSVSYTLSASAGSFVLAGQDASLQKSSILTEDAGSFLEVGQSINLYDSRSIAAAAGSFLFAGQDATLRKSSLLIAAAGSFVEIGQDANLVYTPGTTYTLSAGAGLFFLTGQDADLIKGPAQLPDSPFGPSWGASLQFTKQRRLAEAAEVIPARVYTLKAEVGAFYLTGQPITFLYQPWTSRLAPVFPTPTLDLPPLQISYQLTAAPGAFVFAAAEARLKTGRRLPAEGVRMTLQGSAAQLLRQAGVSLEAGVLTLQADAASLLAAKRLTATPAAFTADGSVLRFRPARRLQLQAGAFKLQGSAAGLTYRPIPWAQRLAIEDDEWLLLQEVA